MRWSISSAPEGTYCTVQYSTVLQYSAFADARPTCPADPAHSRTHRGLRVNTHDTPSVHVFNQHSSTDTQADIHLLVNTRPCRPPRCPRTRCSQRLQKACNEHAYTNGRVNTAQWLRQKKHAKQEGRRARSRSSRLDYRSTRCIRSFTERVHRNHKTIDPPREHDHYHFFHRPTCSFVHPHLA